MVDLKKFISDTSVTFIASSLVMLMAFPINFIIGRFFGPSDLGLYRITITIFSTWILFAELGLSTAIVKYIAQNFEDENKIKEYVSSGVLTALVLGTASFFVMYFASYHFGTFFGIPNLETLLTIVSFCFPFAIMNGVLLGIAIGFKKMKTNALAEVVRNTLMLFFTILLLVAGYGIKGAIIATVVSFSLTTLLLLYLLKLKNLTLSNYKEATYDMVSFGSRTVIANGINLINYQADVLMIGYFLLDYDVGIYSVAVMFAKLVWILPDSIQKITYPLFAEYYIKQEVGQIELIVNRCMQYSFLFLLFCSSFTIMFGKNIIVTVFGMEFKESIYPLIILLFGTVIYGVTKSVGSIFAAVGKVSLVYRIPLVSAITNLILNLMLIPTFGIKGAAIATSISLIVSAMLMIYFLNKDLNVRFNLNWYTKVGGFVSLLLMTFLVGGSSIKLGIFMIGCQFLFSFTVLPSKDRETIIKFLSSHL